MNELFQKDIEIIKVGCELLADYLELHYPNVRKVHYAADSLCSIHGDDFINRMATGVYIELAKAGLIKGYEK